MEKVIMAWSGGKESALALYKILESKSYKVLALLTTINQAYARVCMHGVREELVEKQALVLGVPLEKIFLSKNSSNQEYEQKMKESLEKYIEKGISGVVFGDVYLEDLRIYRENKLKGIGLRAIFPLWRTKSQKIVQEFIEAGFKAIISCLDHKVLDKKFLGRDFNQGFVEELPSGVDPIGEKGEFHSFVYQAPIFRERILFEKGEILLRENGFWYCDLIPASANQLREKKWSRV